MKPFVLVAVLAAAMLPAGVRAQSADTVLVNGKVITLDGRSSVAPGIAIHDGRILETGTNEDVRKRADAHTKVIDLGGRTVIPGLMDSHIHALRAGLTYSVELSWIGVPSLAKGLDLIREAARTTKPDQWIKIGGGWTELQFAEKRGPTVAELAAAAPDRPVYVQRLYNTAWITPAGIKLMNLTPATEIPGGTAEKDAGGNLTGVFTGVNRTFNFFTAKIPGPGIQDQYAGTKKYFRELNRLGMTAINDFPGGGMLPEHFNAVQQLWQKGEQTLRVIFHISGDSLAEYKALTAFTPMSFGDDWLKFRGIGESLTRGIYDGSTVGLPYDPSDKDRAEFCAVAKWAAEQDLNVHQHAASDKAASLILDCFEEVNKVLPIQGLRWQIAHLENVSEATLRRMKALNVGWAVQDRLLYAGPIVAKVLGPEGSRRAPPIATALKMGLHVAAGTDSDQVAPYNPFVSLRWLLDGKMIDGTPMRGPEESPSREEALRMYSLNSAWFTFDEDIRGSLEPGKYADLAVLSEDYMTVPVEKIGELTSLLTMIGGKAVYGEGPFAALEGKL
ncbi:MAG TPA: amidohydrolase [Xanthobacteraceae bacterium]|jgi:predicted amidohydrolase YtcJ|nr:amidohydrolase [Xanthobacteraceae bacterium]